MGIIALTKKRVKPKKLSAKQRRFCAEFVIDYNGTRAARAAHYAHPDVAAAKLQKNPIVARQIGDIQRADCERLELSREEVLRAVALNLRRDPIDLCDEHGAITIDDLRKIPESMRRCVEAIKCKQRFDRQGNVIGKEITIKLVPKHPTIVLAARIVGLLTPIQLENDHVVNIDWDALFRRTDNHVDAIEDKIRAVSNDVG